MCGVKTMDEDQYLDELNQTRATEAQEKAESAPMPEKPEVPFPLFYFILGLANDVLDYVGFVGSIPILGDILDLVVSAIRWYGKQIRKQRTQNLNLLAATLIEFVPGGDIVPSYTLEVLLTYSQEKAAAKKEYDEAISAYQGQLETEES